MSFDYVGTRETADRLILRFGMKAYLRRAGIDRDCWVVIIDYMPHERAAQLTHPTDRRVIISAGLGAVPSEPPDFEAGDLLVTFVQPQTNPPIQHEVLPFTSPVKITAPAGVIVLYEATVRR